MRFGYMVLAAAASIFVASPLAVAFQVQSAPTSSDGSSKFTDPDDATNQTAAHLTGDSTASSGSVLHFGSTTLSIGGSSGSNADTMSPALQERLMGGYVGSSAVGLPNR
jgi:ethanolamine utilization microcompartment shell protein EutL